MTVENFINVHSREEFRAWLTENHEKEACCWAYCEHGKPQEDGKLYYLDAVEECLCFGWIDGIHKTVEGYGHIQRFSPRSKKSPWSELNKERVRRLERLGKMTDAGRRILPDMDIKHFVVCRDLQETLDGDERLRKNFESFPLLYRRVRIDAVQREIKKPAVYERMKKTFIEKTREGKIYGSWDDYGRLLE